MSAVVIIDRLLRLGGLIHDKFEESGESDFSKFLKSATYEEIKQAVEQLVAGLPDKEIEKAVVAINEKRQALLRGRTVAELPSDQMVQYLQLGDARRVLRTKSMAAAANADFLGWVTNSVLPVLVQIAPSLLPLLL